MSKRQAIKTKIEDAVRYWSERVDECGLSVDWAEASTHCWRCGCEKNLQRCHIIPDSLGGKDEPANIVLLCKRCHIDGPNVDNPDIMWDWIRAYGVPFYETFWGISGMKEYEFIYKSSFGKDIDAVLKSANITPSEEEMEIVNSFVKEAIKGTSIHFGHPYLNVSTIAGVYRTAVKKLAEHYGVPMPEARKQDEPSIPWWSGYVF